MNNNHKASIGQSMIDNAMPDETESGEEFDCDNDMHEWEASGVIEGDKQMWVCKQCGLDKYFTAIHRVDMSRFCLERETEKREYLNDSKENR